MSVPRQPRSSIFLHGLALVLALGGAWAIGSCKDSSQAAGTSVFVNVDIPDAFTVTQLRFSAKAESGALFEPVIRPRDDIGARLSTGQTIRILLPDALDGHFVGIAAEGLSLGRIVAEDHRFDVRVRKGFEVEVDLTLGGVAPNCGACAGCCSGVACVTSYSVFNCGSDVICATCSRASSDTCANGECRCGSNPPCVPDAGSDRCVQGQCRCGANDPCQPGQECVDGGCACTVSSCPSGCCAGNTCVPRGDAGPLNCGSASFACQQCSFQQTCTGGVCSDCPAGCRDGCCSGETCHSSDFFSCGKNGTACIACDPIAADSCTNGICSCGSGPACGQGLHCVSGACRCDALSCPNGCCRENICEGTQSAGGGSAPLAACGKSGRTCAVCDPLRSDTCTSSGVCACGTSPACDPGTRCLNGSCVCDPATCAGCCSLDGLSCRLGNSDNECGRQGLTCQTCPSGQSCAGGVCSGCTPSTCSGCCVGSTCVATTPGPCRPDAGNCYCGSSGTSCHSCLTLTTDSCGANGSCGCGVGAPCLPGQQCINGLCICTRTSCPSGCCASNSTCQQPSINNCGTSGSSCFGCSSMLANNCSSSGDCRCGSSPACSDGQECQASGCVCSPASCPSGCCNSSRQCLAPSASSCGISGSSCFPCDTVRANRCVNGVCACGDGGVCAAGQQCVNGTCQCTATSCPSGCCSGTTCTVPSPNACGINGAGCVACPTGAVCVSGACQCCFADGGSCTACGIIGDHCNGNTCRCFSRAACMPGQRCVGPAPGSCI